MLFLEWPFLVNNLSMIWLYALINCIQTISFCRPNCFCLDGGGRRMPLILGGLLGSLDIGMWPAQNFAALRVCWRALHSPYTSVTLQGKREKEIKEFWSPLNKLLRRLVDLCGKLYTGWRLARNVCCQIFVDEKHACDEHTQTYNSFPKEVEWRGNYFQTCCLTFPCN